MTSEPSIFDMVPNRGHPSQQSQSSSSSAGGQYLQITHAGQSFQPGAPFAMQTTVAAQAQSAYAGQHLQISDPSASSSAANPLQISQSAGQTSQSSSSSAAPVAAQAQSRWPQLDSTSGTERELVRRTVEREIVQPSQPILPPGTVIDPQTIQGILNQGLAHLPALHQVLWG